MTEPMKAAGTTDGDTKARLVQCFREAFPALDEEQIVSAKYAEIEAWDSLASLTLVAIVEEEFSCTLPDELVAELTSFDRILAAVSDPTDAE